MPGPKRINETKQGRQAAVTEAATYYVMDPNCREIHGIELTDEMRENGIRLTENEAMSLIASGAITTSKDQMTLAHKAAADRADAKAKAAEQSAADAQAREAEVLKTAVANTAGTEFAVKAPETSAETAPATAEAAPAETAPAATSHADSDAGASTWAQGQAQGDGH